MYVKKKVKYDKLIYMIYKYIRTVQLDKWWVSTYAKLKFRC